MPLNQPARYRVKTTESGKKIRLAAFAKGCETVICKCGNTMGPLPSFGKGIAWIEEGRPRTFYNIGPQPITVTSQKQYREALRRHGVREAGAQITSDNNNHTKRVTLTAKGRWI